jgi:glycosyltransferase involved in cell wall biosynthesis
VTEQERSSVQVCFLASNAQLGGTELFLDSLLDALGPEWIGEVLVLGEGPFAARLRDHGIAAKQIRCGRRAGLLSGAFRVRRILSRTSPPVIHANGVKAALVAVLASAGTRVRVVWHKQDCARDGRVARWIARRCALVVGVSSTVLRTFGDDAARTTIVHNAIPRYEVDREDAREELVRELGAPPDSPVVGQVGRLAPGKGQLELVEIAPQLRERFPDLRLVFVGDPDPHQPDYAEELRGRVEELALADSVTFLGHRDDAVRITAGLDLLAIPSLPDPVSGWREGFPFAPLEAMAVGTPVAGYAEPAIVEELGPCAALVPPGNRAELRAAIEELIASSGTRERLRGCGTERIRRFELPEAAARMKEIFAAVAANRPVKPAEG